MRKILIFIVLCFVFVSFKLKAQTVEINGQLRPRAEYRHGYHTLLSNKAPAAAFVSQRTRLNLIYSSKKVKSEISLQNIRTWGDNAVSARTDVSGSMLYQAYGEVFLNKNWSLKAGRQAIQYDDQRLFSLADWAQQAKSHDALLVRYYNGEIFRADLGLMYNQNLEKDTGNFYSLLSNYKAIQYAWIHNKQNHWGLSFIFVNNGIPGSVKTTSKAKQTIRYTQTLGPYVSYSGKKLNASSACYFQVGKNVADIEKQAFYFSAELHYSFTPLVKAGIGFQRLSGNNYPENSNTDHEFVPLYGTGHTLNGWMDYFYAGNSHKGVGLVDIYWPATMKSGKFTAEFQLHYYRAAAKVYNQVMANNYALDPALGVQAGVKASYSFAPELSFTAGYSQMFATSTLEFLKGGNRNTVQNWAWMMLTFNPVFFKSEK